MINKDFIKSLKKDYKTNETERRSIIGASNPLLFEAKKVIFKLQRHDSKEAKKSLDLLEKKFKDLQKKYGAKRLSKEGAYKAACEEYLEAKTFYLAINKQEIKAISGLDFSYDSYLGGICDMLGELVRYSTNLASAGKYEECKQIKNIGEDIMSQLIDFDMTGYLRTKYDQAKGHLRKLEQISYEISLRLNR